MATPMPKSVSFLERIETVWKTKVAYEYAYKSAYLSPSRWSCIYGSCSTSWIIARIYSHWTGFFPYLQYLILQRILARAVYVG